MTELSRGILFLPSSKNTPSSPTYRRGRKTKVLHEENPVDELPAGIVYGY